MERKTIHCTEEQTKKALKLGAPIKIETRHVGGFMFGLFHLEKHYVTPTAEQMVEWLEEQDGIEEITICKTGMWIWGKNHTLIDGGSTYSSRKESSLAAIDAALAYLGNKKNKS